MSDTEDENYMMATKLPHYHLQRKQRRKTRTRQSQEEGEEPPIIRGLWVQEIDWLKSAEKETTSAADIIPPPPQFTDSASVCCSRGDLRSCMYESCTCVNVCDCVRRFEGVSLSEERYRSADTDDTSRTDDRGGSDSDCGLEQDSESVCTHESESDSSCCAEDDIRDDFGVEDSMSNSTFDRLHVSGFKSSSSHADSDSTGCEQSRLGLSDSTFTPITVDGSRCFDDMSDVDTVLNELRGRVTQMPKQFVSPFFNDLMKQTTKHINEGLIFHHVRHLHLV